MNSYIFRNRIVVCLNTLEPHSQSPFVWWPFTNHKVPKIRFSEHAAGSTVGVQIRVVAVRRLQVRTLLRACAPGKWVHGRVQARSLRWSGHFPESSYPSVGPPSLWCVPRPFFIRPGLYVRAVVSSCEIRSIGRSPVWLLCIFVCIRLMQTD